MYKDVKARAKCALYLIIDQPYRSVACHVFENYLFECRMFERLVKDCLSERLSVRKIICSKGSMCEIVDNETKQK